MFIVAYLLDDDHDDFVGRLSLASRSRRCLRVPTSTISILQVTHSNRLTRHLTFPSCLICPRFSSVYHMIPLRHHDRIYQHTTEDITNDNVMLVTREKRKLCLVVYKISTWSLVMQTYWLWLVFGLLSLVLLSTVSLRHGRTYLCAFK